MFSNPVNSGLNPAPNSNNALIFPFTSIFPAEGVATPVISFSNVDFPEPDCPIMATYSPNY